MSAFSHHGYSVASPPTTRLGGLLPGPRPGPSVTSVSGWPRAASAPAGSCHSYSPARKGCTGALSPSRGRKTYSSPVFLACGRGPSPTAVPSRAGPGRPLAALPEAGRVVALEAPLVLPPAGRLPAKFVVSYIVVSNGLRSLILEGEDAGGARVRAPIPLPAALLPDVQQPERQTPTMDRVMQGMSSAEGTEREEAPGERRPALNGTETAGPAGLAVGGVQQAVWQQVDEVRVHGDAGMAPWAAGTQAAAVAAEGGQGGEGSRGRSHHMGAARVARAEAAAGSRGAADATSITSPASGLPHQGAPLRAANEQREEQRGREALPGAPEGADGRNFGWGTAGQQVRQGTDCQPARAQQQRHGSTPQPQQQGSDVPALQRPERPSVSRLLASFSPTVLVRRSVGLRGHSATLHGLLRHMCEHCHHALFHAVLCFWARSN